MKLNKKIEGTDGKIEFKIRTQELVEKAKESRLEAERDLTFRIGYAESQIIYLRESLVFHDLPNDVKKTLGKLLEQESRLSEKLPKEIETLKGDRTIDEFLQSEDFSGLTKDTKIGIIKHLIGEVNSTISRSTPLSTISEELPTEIEKLKGDRTIDDFLQSEDFSGSTRDTKIGIIKYLMGDSTIVAFSQSKNLSTKTQNDIKSVLGIKNHSHFTDSETAELNRLS